MSVPSHGELSAQPGPADLVERRPLRGNVLPDWRDVAPTDEASGGVELDIAQYWRLLIKHRWLIAAIIFAALCVGATVTLLTQPIYTANASLQLDREAAKVVSTQDATPSEELIAGDEFFQTQYALLRSRSLAIRVAEGLGLTQTDVFIRQMGANPKGGGRRDEVLKLLGANLGVTPTRGSRLVTVSFSSPDPALSA